MSWAACGACSVERSSSKHISCLGFDCIDETLLRGGKHYSTINDGSKWQKLYEEEERGKERGKVEADLKGEAVRQK